MPEKDSLCEGCNEKTWEIKSLGKKLCNDCYVTTYRQAHESW